MQNLVNKAFPSPCLADSVLESSRPLRRNTCMHGMEAFADPAQLTDLFLRQPSFAASVSVNSAGVTLLLR